MRTQARGQNAEIISNSTRLAVGLAAIDGLTSAFVAMLALALALQGGQTLPPSAFNSCSTQVQIHQPTSKDSSQILLSVYVRASANGKVASGMASSIGRDVSKSSVVDILTRDKHPLLENAQIRWSDCISNNCFNYLSITGAPPASDFKIVIRAANTIGALTDKHPRAVSIDARASPDPKSVVGTIDLEHGSIAYQYSCSAKGEGSFALAH